MKRFVTACCLSVAILGWSPVLADECDNATTQLDLNTCAGQTLERSDAELNVLYKQIMQRLGSGTPEAKKLIAAQKSWIAFRDNECEFTASGVEGGSVYPMIVIMCRNTLTERRVEDLKTYLNCQEGDLSCPVPRQ